MELSSNIMNGITESVQVMVSEGMLTEIGSVMQNITTQNTKIDGKSTSGYYQSSTEEYIESTMTSEVIYLLRKFFLFLPFIVLFTVSFQFSIFCYYS